MRFVHLGFAMIATGLVAVLSTANVQAGTVYWIGGTTSTNYATAANWSGGALPTGSDEVKIGISGYTPAAAVMDSDTTYTSTGRLLIGYGGAGTLSVSAGTLNYGSPSNYYSACYVGATGAGSGSGVLNVTGSSAVNITNNSAEAALWIGGGGNDTNTSTTSGSICVGGGTINIGHHALLGWRAQTSNLGTVISSLTIDSGAVNIGTGTYDTTGTVYGQLYIGCNSTATTSSATVNLNGGILSLSKIVGSASTAGSVTINLNGGTLSARANATNFLAGSTSMVKSGSGVFHANVDNGGARIDTSSYAITIGASLEHHSSNATDGGLTKYGAGTLTLLAGNNYNGKTTVAAGLLNVAGSLGYNTADHIYLQAGTNTSSLGTHAGGTISRYSVGDVPLAALTPGATAYGGKFDTSAVILGGTTSGTQTISVSFRDRYDTEKPDVVHAGSSYGIISEVLNLTGIATIGSKYGLKLSYSETELTETLGGAESNVFIAWYNTNSGLWENICTAAKPTPAYSDSLDVGSWGINTGSNEIWVVTNKTGSFAVVPEPGTLALLAAGLVGLIAYAWRKRK